MQALKNKRIGGVFKDVLFSPRSLGKWSNLTIFQMGWFNHHLVNNMSRFWYILNLFGSNNINRTRNEQHLRAVRKHLRSTKLAYLGMCQISVGKLFSQIICPKYDMTKPTQTLMILKVHLTHFVRSFPIHFRLCHFFMLYKVIYVNYWKHLGVADFFVECQNMGVSKSEINFKSTKFVCFFSVWFCIYSL